MPGDNLTYLALGLLGGGVLAGLLFWLREQSITRTVTYEVVRDEQGRIQAIRKKLGNVTGRVYTFQHQLTA